MLMSRKVQLAVLGLTLICGSRFTAQKVVAGEAPQAAEPPQQQGHEQQGGPQGPQNEEP